MKDIATLGIMIDPRDAKSGADQVNNSLDQMGNRAEAAQSKISLAMSKATSAIFSFNQAVQAARSLYELYDSTIGKMIATGISFNSTLQDAQISIAAVFRSSNPSGMKDFATAFTTAGTAVDYLKQKSANAPTIFRELATSYAGTASIMANAGMTIRQQVDTLILLQNVLKASGTPEHNIPIVTREILQGNINNREPGVAGAFAASGGLAKAKDDMEKARSEGTLYEYFQKTFSTYNESMVASTNSFSNALTNLKDVIDITLGDATLSLFKELNKDIIEVKNSINSAGWEQAFKPLIDGLTTATSYAKQYVKAIAADPQNAGSTTRAFANMTYQNIGAYLGTNWQGELSAAADFFWTAFKKGAATIATVFLDFATPIAAALEAAFDVALAYLTDKLSELFAKWGKSLSSTTFSGLGSSVAEQIAHSLGSALTSTSNDLENSLAFDKATTHAGMKTFQDYFNGENEPKSHGWAGSYDDFHDAGRLGQTTAASHMLTQGAVFQSNSLLAPITPANQEASKKAWDDLAAKAADTSAKIVNDGNFQTWYNALFGSMDKASVLDKKMAELRPPDQEAQKRANQLTTLNDQMGLLRAQAGGSEQDIARQKQLLDGDKLRAELIERYSGDLDKIDATYNEMLPLQNQITNRTIAQYQAELQLTKLKEKQAEVQGKITLVEGDPFASLVSKNQQLNGLYGQQIELIERIIQANNSKIATLGPAEDVAKIQLQEQNVALQTQLGQLQNQQKQTTPQGQFLASLQSYANSFGTTAQQIAGVITGTLGNAISSVTDEIVKAQTGVESWGQAFRNVVMDILQSIEKLIIKMALTAAIQTALNAYTGGGASVSSSLAGLATSQAHTGGVWGEDSFTSRRVTVPHFHTGGITMDETPAILKKGETVLTPAQKAQLASQNGSKGTTQPNIDLHVAVLSDHAAFDAYLATNPKALQVAVMREAKTYRRAFNGG